MESRSRRRTRSFSCGPKLWRAHRRVGRVRQRSRRRDSTCDEGDCLLLIKPRRLEPGMTIGLIAPASGATNPEDIDAGIIGLKGAGFKIKEGHSMRSRVGYLAASDHARAADI